MSITRNFTLYLHSGLAVPPTIHVNQYDQGETWVFTLLDSTGAQYTPTTGALIGVKSDGHAIAGVTGTINANGQVVITETQQMTAAAGRAIYELTIDGGSHGTANFIVQVEPKPTDGAVLSDSDLSIIQQGMNSVTPVVIAETVSDWLEDNLTDPPIDPSLTISNAAADAKVTGDKITDLKTAFNEVETGLNTICGDETTESFTWIENSYVSESGVITSYNGWHRTDYEEIGDVAKVYLYATSGSQTQTYNCWFDENKQFISNFLCNSTITEYTPPTNAKYFMLSTANSNSVERRIEQYTVEKLISNIGFEPESIEVLNSVASSMTKEGFDWIDGSYVHTNGEIRTDETWHRTDYIDIEDANVIYLFSSSASPTQVYNCWYNSSKQFISNFLCNSTITKYTPPENAKYFILSTGKVNTITRGIKECSVDALKGNLGIGKDKPSFTYRGSLSANASYNTKIGIAPKIGFKFGLFASLSGAFDDITIQLDAYSPNQIIVDDTNVTLKYRFASDVVLPHGVTIADDVAINVLMDNPSTIKVTVASKGVQNTVSGSFSITAYETLQILNGNQALSNLVITVGCTTVNHDVWVFGDSYLGMTNPARWTYYLNANDFTKNVMLCGSTGSGKAESDIWFNSFLTLGTPKKIVWCMGMNYSSDGSSAPSSAWLTQVQDVKDVCDANGIELILATIPTVPTKNHEQKNAYVRSSGLRYIDFAKAVGAQSDGTWYGGMLSSDGVHPSETGAVALYNMAIASVPELTYDYR